MYCDVCHKPIDGPIESMCDCDECPICRGCGCEHQKEEARKNGRCYNILDLCYHHTGIKAQTEEEAVKAVNRAVFKYTASGCFFYYQHPLNESYGYVVVSGYCEGVDWGFENFLLKFPFEYEDFEIALAEADDEGCQVWDDTHGCEHCGEPGEFGYIPINSNCRNCGGCGIIL